MIKVLISQLRRDAIEFEDETYNEVAALLEAQASRIVELEIGLTHYACGCNDTCPPSAIVTNDCGYIAKKVLGYNNG